VIRHQAKVRTATGDDLPVDRALNTMASVLYDAVLVPCGQDSTATLRQDGYAMHFILEAYKHAKPVAAFGSGVDLLRDTGVRGPQLAENTDITADQGVVTSTAAADDLDGERGDEFATTFATDIARHRAWERDTDAVPA